MKKEQSDVKISDLVDDALYSDPEDGVEIVDMDDVKRMDWMAPESLKKERRSEGRNRHTSVRRDSGRPKGKGKAKGSVILF